MSEWDETWPYHITVQRRDWDVVEQWCEVNIGEFGRDWYKLGVDPAVYILEGDYRTRWYFKTKSNAVFFQLKWA